MRPVKWVLPHLCCLTAIVRDRRRLMFIKGFFDETNKDSKRGSFVLAGWTAPVEDWEKFTTAWSSCLSALPSIGYFKSSECKKLDGQFKGFTRELADKKRLALAKVIGAHRFRCYISYVKHESFSDRPKEARKLGIAGCYDWAFMNLAAMVFDDHLRLKDIEGKIDLVFDKCSELRAAIESYEEERKRWVLPMQNIAGEIIPGDDRELAGLQASDMLARELSLYSKNKTTGDIYDLMLAGRSIIRSEVEIPKKLIEGFSDLKALRDGRKFMEALFKNLRGCGNSAGTSET